ncbi:MAG: SPFH domain-containing protein [Phycisphaerae bacterium]|jgi:regulator of protease activity HflC (stomatin/prohibitin superfamily)
MAETKTAGDRRAQHVALFGLLLQSAAFAALVIIAAWSDSYLVAALARFTLFGVPIWLVLYLILNQIRRVEIETLETEELRRARQAGTSQALFGVDDESLLIEQNRAKWMARWLLPACTVLVAAYLLIGHLAAWGWSLDEAFDEIKLPPSKQPTFMMWFVIGIGFALFLYSRYTLGVARIPRWQPLRAGAVCMAGGAPVCVIVALALAASGTIEWAEPLVTYAIRIAILILGFEFSVNFILDLYRPRVPGEFPRPSFDSRLLGMVAEPGDIAKSIADAFNYQFGFQVSSTWFYQLLQRWLFPIVVAAFVVVLLLTSVVIVDAQEQAVVERFGRRLGGPNSVLQPGIHLKWPFPVDIVRRAPVKQVGELVIGEAIGDEEDSEKHAHDAVIWTTEHKEFVPELMLLVASPKTDEGSIDAESIARNDGGDVGESVAVSLLMVSVPIEYRIKDIDQYLYRYEDPEKLMENVAYRYLSDYAASVDLDELIGPGRASFNAHLKEQLQARLDDFGVGIDIVFVGIRGAHPPAQSGVAAAFQSVVSAETRMGASLNAARGEARKVLTAVAGTEAHALALDEAIRLKRSLPADSPDLPSARERVDDLLMGNPEEGIVPISGWAAKLIAEARARAAAKKSDAASKVQVFETQVAAYLAAPELYKQRKALEIYLDLGQVRKYLIAGDRSNVIIEYETTKEAGLDEVLSQGVERERKKRDSRGTQSGP